MDWGKKESMGPNQKMTLMVEDLSKYFMFPTNTKKMKELGGQS
jgi:hypothetical protein